MPNSEGRDLRLICFPPESRFEIGVHAAVDAAVESGHGSILESVEVKLRETYPDVIVIVHEPFGAQGEDAQTTWIVYRDGQKGRLDQQHEQRPVALVVDDEPLVVVLISAVLAARGWQVLRASNGEDALARAEGLNVDLLVTDYDMPGMNGRTLATLLRDRDPSLAVLMVSGQIPTADWVEGVDYAFLAKPFAIEDLAGRVETLTGYRAAWSGFGMDGS